MLDSDRLHSGLGGNLGAGAAGVDENPARMSM
jgi:hypothetical protein